MDVRAQRLERGDVNDPSLLRQLMIEAFTEQVIQRAEKGG
jgi:hypothetical protein